MTSKVNANDGVYVYEYLSLDDWTLDDLQEKFQEFADQHGMPVDQVALRTEADGELLIQGRRPFTEKELEKRREADRRKKERDNKARALKEARERAEYEKLKAKYG